MTEERPWHSSVGAIVVHPTEPLVWVPDDGDPLLRIETDEELPTYDVETLLTLVLERWHIQAIVLRGLEERVDRDTRHVELSYLMAARTCAMPTSGRWRGLADLELDRMPSDSRWDVFSAALHDFNIPSPPTRRLWSERGWFDEADRWAVAALHAAGIRPDQPVAQARTWGLSTVHRYRTSRGNIYFKAAAHGSGEHDAPGSRSLLFANEAVLLPAFATRFPGYVPCPIAVDEDRVWMLLPDAGQFLGESQDIERWEAAIRVHARHQRETLGQVVALREMGCLDRGLARLSVDLDDLVSDSEAMAFLEPADQDRFLTAMPTIKALIAELAMLGIPDTFNHGDLHPWNIGTQEDSFVFFDWTDACITHPFLDLASYLGSTHVLKDVPDARDRLLSAYLDEWQDFAPRDALECSASVAEMLSMAHQAVSYQHMIRSLEGPSRTDMGEGIPHWVKRLLERMA